MLLLSANSWTTAEMIAQLFFILIVLIGVIILAVYVTRFVAGAKYIRRGNNNLKLMDSIGLGFQNGIHLVKAGKKYVLLGITKDRITFLCELSESDIENIEQDSGYELPSFDNYLNRILRKKNNSNSDEDS